MRLLKQSRSGIILLDLATSLTIISFLIWIFGGVIGTLSRNARETALRYQLNNFRMLVLLYKELKGNYPKDLKVLTQFSYRLSQSDELIFKEKLLDNLAQDKDGNSIDAFGNLVYYDSGRGVVGSTTKGYENW